MPRLRALLVPLVVAAALAPGTALAQDDAADARAIASDLERLRNTSSSFFSSDPERVRQIVVSLLNRRSGRADAALRDLLLAPTTHPNVVEQIVSTTLVAAPHALLPDVVERLRVEGSPDLEARLARTLLHADGEVVAGLAAAARDVRRPDAYRATAIRLLGRTGAAAALAPLAELWAGPQPGLRDAARDAFDAIVPGAAATPEEAAALAERIARDDVPLSEALRRMLRERTRPATPESAPAAGLREYTDLALALLPGASLDQVLELYVLGAPVPAVRAAAARRLASFPYDDAADADGRTRAARALFTALRREDTAEAEEAILTTLVALAPAVRGNVATEEMEALLARVRSAGAANRTPRGLAVRLVGELRDERAVPALEEAYRSLAEGDVDARLALLEALQEIPVERTAWLVGEVRAEPNPRVLRRLLLLLGRSHDPAAVAAFAGLLDPPHADPEIRREAAKALATEWASRSDASAFGALARRGLADADPGVRATAAGALGIGGAAKDDALAALLGVVGKDLDADVRRAAARSILRLDEARALEHLGAFLEADPVVLAVVRDHLVESVRRDQAADRVLAAAAALADAGRRPLAIPILEAAIEAAPDGPRARGALRERLARFLLDEGRPADAERLARIQAADAKDEPARDRAELLLARALTASNDGERLREAHRRLVALRGAGRLPPALDAEAALTLGECLLRRGDAVAAAEVLAPEPRDAAAPVRLRFDQLRGDARRRIAAQRTEVLALVDRLSGPDAEAARERLRTEPFAGDAAWHLAEVLATTSDAAAAHRLLAAAEVLTGASLARPEPDAPPEKVAQILAAARDALAKVPRSSAVSPSR